MNRYIDEDWLRLVGAAVTALFVALVAAFLVPGAHATEPRTLLNVSYDPTWELYRDAGPGLRHTLAVKTAVEWWHRDELALSHFHK